MLSPWKGDAGPRLIPSNIYVQRLDDAPELCERAGQGGRAVLGLQHAHNGAGVDAAEFERSGQAQQVLPVPADELDVDPVAGQAVERAVVGGPVNAPEAGIADVGEPGAELVAQEPEQPEHRVSVGCSIGHDFRGFEVGFLVEQQSQDQQAVAQWRCSSDRA
jgi:hypothetical protein